MMVARGIDPGPEGEAIAPEPKLYLKHVPTIDIGAEPDRSLARNIGKIIVWRLFAWAGIALAGWI